MNIACISTTRVPSQAANSIQVMKTCQALSALGNETRLFVPEPPKGAGDARGWEDLASLYGLSTRFQVTWLPAAPAFKRNDFAVTAVRRAGEMKADLIYTWAGQSAVFGLLSGRPVAYEVHDRFTGLLGPRWFSAFLRLRGKKRILPITRALLRALEQRFGKIPPEQVIVSPNGVDLEQYSRLPSAAEARRQLALPEAPTVLCAGHLYAGRGADLFLGLAGRFAGASFVWVGGRAEDIERYRRQAEAGGLRNVTFTGFIPNRALPCYQAAANVLLMPYARSIAGSSGGNSADICSPMKMFDYLAAGRAILSSDLPVIREVLNESNARFAPPEDLPSWAEALGRLLSDADLRARLAGQARLDAQQYSWLGRAEKVIRSLTPA